MMYCMKCADEIKTGELFTTVMVDHKHVEYYHTRCNFMCAKPKEAVIHPDHYNAGKVECIDALEAATVKLTGIEAFYTANIIKYLWRWRQKSGLEDLKKAANYLQMLIRKVEGESIAEKVCETVHRNEG